MTYENDGAFPVFIHEIPGEHDASVVPGLTKREAFAMAAIQGHAVHVLGCNPLQIREYADAAVALADALIDSLNGAPAPERPAVQGEGF